MAKSKSLTVLTIMSSVFALQACSEGITSADEALSNLSNQTSSEATDSPEISIGAANPTGTETTIPVTPSGVSNYIVNNISILPGSSPPPSPDEEVEPGLAPETDSEGVTDIPAETDPEDVVTDIPAETDPEEIVTDIPAETDPEEVVTDIPAETDPEEVVTDIAPEIKEEEVASEDHTPVLDAPAEGELVPYGSKIQFAWSIPVASFETVTGFDFAIADASEGVVSYRDNGVSISSCNDTGLCTLEINSVDLPIPEGDNIWSVSSLGGNVSLNTAEATFTLDKNLEVQIADGLSLLSPAAGYVADSASVDFEWEDLSNPNAVYDLHVYSDAARTEKVTGTNGVIFDTAGIGTATSHTFTSDPSDGGTRYGLLWQWPDANYDLASRKETLFEYTASTKSVKAVVLSGRLNDDIAFTDNADEIAKAFEYEDKFYSSLGSFEAFIDSVYKDQTNAQWFARDYSGVNGVRFYHLYEYMFSLGKVLRLTHIENPTHAEAYKNIALRYVRENVDIFLNLRGLEGAPTSNPSIFHPNPDFWRFLDASRGLAWMAYLMDSILYTDNSYASEFSGYANQLKPMMSRYLDTGNHPGRNPHMASHTALGALMLGRIGNYMPEVKERIVTPLMNVVVTNIDPWNLSDINHAAQSEQALFYVYESNLRGLSLPELSSINSSLITTLANNSAPRLNNGNYLDSVSPHTGSYGELVKFNSGIASHIGLPSDYSNTGRAWITTAHIAYGYAINDGK